MRDADAARMSSGISYSAIGRALHLGPGQVARILRGQSPNVSIVRAAQVLEVVGLELAARAFPTSTRVRDAAQLALLARLRPRVHATLRWREEVPVREVAEAGSIDLRAWDAAIDGRDVAVRIDAETRVGDAQAVTRRIALKQRDSGVVVVILLLADTRHHRDLLAGAGQSLRAAFPVPQRAALAALRDGRSPSGNALVLL